MSIFDHFERSAPKIKTWSSESSMLDFFNKISLLQSASMLDAFALASHQDLVSLDQHIIWFQNCVWMESNNQPWGCCACSFWLPILHKQSKLAAGNSCEYLQTCFWVLVVSHKWRCIALFFQAPCYVKGSGHGHATISVPRPNLQVSAVREILNGWVGAWMFLIDIRFINYLFRKHTVARHRCSYFLPD